MGPQMRSDREADLTGASVVACYDCGRPYGDEYGFPDLVVPHEVWNNDISPTGDEGGLLCPSCMCKRAYDAGVQCVAVFRSGPFVVEESDAPTQSPRKK